MNSRPPHKIPLVSPGSNGPPGTGGGNMSGGNYESSDNHLGDILQTSTTIAGLAAALLALFPAFPALANFKLIEIGGGFYIPCSLILLLCGTCAIFSGLGAINSLRKEKNIPLVKGSLFTSLGLLFLSLVFFFFIYLGMDITYIHF